MAKECPRQIGDRLGKLTIIGKELRHTLEGSRGRRRMYLHVRCDCGTTKWIRACDVRPGSIVSCGCQRRSLDGESNTPRHRLYKSVKQRAKNKELPFDLTLDDIQIPEVCPILGIPLQHHTEPGCYDNSPSVDRKVPKLGYVRSNIWVISGLANRIKNSGSPEQVMLVATKLQELL